MVHTLQALPTHANDICLQNSSLHKITEQVSLNKWPPSSPGVRSEIRHWRNLQTEEAEINKEEGMALEMTSTSY